MTNPVEVGMLLEFHISQSAMGQLNRLLLDCPGMELHWSSFCTKNWQLTTGDYCLTVGAILDVHQRDFFPFFWKINTSD